jgi:glycosyltransferase involved in cell wall biosynthesis
VRRFTIVLPVRNGGRYVRECVDSVLAQSLGDFTLHVLENASTDGTAQWLETVRDARVRIWPAPRPLPIEQNWRRALGLAKGEFLLFVGHDDRLDPGYLAVVDQLIRRSPEAALFTTHFRLIDARGQVLRACRPMPARETMAGFLASRLTNRIDMTGVGVVMRSVAHDALGGFPPFEGLVHADEALWLRLLDGSWKATAPDVAFSCRLHPASTTLSLPWRASIAATEQYAAFVRSLGHTGADVEEAWREHAPVFLERRYRFVIFLEMMRTASGSSGFGTREREEVLASLEGLSPRAADRLRRRWWLRLASWAQAAPLRAPAAACFRSLYWYRKRWQ